MSNPIETERKNGALIVRFFRPEIRNPLSSEVLAGLEAIVGVLEDDPTLRKLIFTGSKNVFASGADLNEIAALTSETAADFGRRGQRLMGQIAGLPMPTIAAINGYCFGGALDLALSCTKRIASPDATFCHPGAGIGIITGWGGTQRLPRLVGQAWAMEMLFTASPISANTAIQIGLVDAIEEDTLAAAMELEQVVRQTSFV